MAYRSDEQLALQAQSELPYITASYEVLIRRYRKSMLSFSMRFLNSKDDAEDVVQDVLLKVFFALKNYDSKGFFKTWIFQIVKNESFNKIKSMARYSTDEPIESLDEAYGLSHLPTSNDAEVKLQAALMTLSNDERQILLLRHLNGFKFKEIAEITELSVSGVKMKCARATEKLSKLLDIDFIN